MKSLLFLVLLCSAMCSQITSAATTREELVSEIDAALKIHDKPAFLKCVNFEGTDKVTSTAFHNWVDDIFSWPSYYIFTTDRIDQGILHATRNGKTYILNGDWVFNLDVYISKPPGKGRVFPAGFHDGKCQILLGILETK